MRRRRSPSSKPTARKRAATDGKDIASRQAGAPPEVQDACIYSLQPLRAPPRGLSQVRGVPYLPARAGPQRPDPRNDEVLLVEGRAFAGSHSDQTPHFPEQNSRTTQCP